MKTQFAKVGNTYPKPTLIRKDDPWTKHQTL